MSGFYFGDFEFFCCKNDPALIACARNHCAVPCSYLHYSGFLCACAPALRTEMALAGVLPPDADILSPLSDQVNVEGSAFDGAEPNAQLRFLQRAHYAHLRGLSRLFASMFPQSFILTLLPAHQECDALAEDIVDFLMRFFSPQWPVAYRMDNLKVDPNRCPGLADGCHALVCPVWASGGRW